jgi:hypothetical protein
MATGKIDFETIFKISIPSLTPHLSPTELPISPLTQKVVRPVFERPLEGGGTEKPAGYPKIIQKDSQVLGNHRRRRRTVAGSYGIEILFSGAMVLKSLLAVTVVLKPIYTI